MTATGSKPDLEVTLPATPQAPAAARRLLAQAGLGEDIEHTVALLTSEIVTNSLTHATHLRGIGIRAQLDRDFACIEVRDTGGGFDPATVAWGFGLRLVDKLATDWGTEEGRYGVVWFEVDRRARRFRRVAV